MDFPFHQVYSLDDYNSRRKEAVFFGMYRYEDWVLQDVHLLDSVIFWTGQDVLQWSDLHLDVMHQRCKSKTAHPKVQEYLSQKGHQCDLVKPTPFLNEVRPQKLGNKIYAYCPSSAPDYHGKKIIDELRCGGYEIVIGDGQFTRKQWKTTAADFHYSQCFIGLCLSEFAGGGESIIEMGLRGMKVVTNVFDLPNCIPWRSIDDVRIAIELESKNIGTINDDLSHLVWNDLDHEHEWLNI